MATATAASCRLDNYLVLPDHSLDERIAARPANNAVALYSPKDFGARILQMISLYVGQMAPTAFIRWLPRCRLRWRARADDRHRRW